MILTNVAGLNYVFQGKNKGQKSKFKDAAVNRDLIVESVDNDSIKVKNFNWHFQLVKKTLKSVSVIGNFYCVQIFLYMSFSFIIMFD